MVKRFSNFTDRARVTLAHANTIALKYDQQFVLPEHILYGFLFEGSGVGVSTLRYLEVNLHEMRQRVEGIFTQGNFRRRNYKKLQLSPESEQIVNLVPKIAIEMGHDYCGTEHFILALLSVPGTEAYIILADMGLTFEKFKPAVQQMLEGSQVNPPEPLNILLTTITQKMG